MLTLDSFFSGWEQSRRLFDAVYSAISALGPVELRITKSQVSFSRKKAFAWIWVPGRYLRSKTAPLVLTLSFPSRSTSPRWKEIVEPHPGRFTHHLELNSIDDIDDEVVDWLHQAWMNAA